MRAQEKDDDILHCTVVISLLNHSTDTSVSNWPTHCPKTIQAVSEMY